MDGVKRPAYGQPLYRGYDVKDLINGSRGGRFAFEEAGYLLLFGELPDPGKAGRILPGAGRVPYHAHQFYP